MSTAVQEFTVNNGTANNRLMKPHLSAKLFGVLTAYIDDSGSQGEGPAFILAGYVADKEQWKAFAEQWQIALDLKPKLTIVKIQHALRLEEGWGRFNSQQRDERLKRFASIIHRHVKMGVVVSCGWDDLRRIKKEFFPKDKFQPYSILFNGLMGDVIKHLDWLGIQEQVDFVFDDQGASAKMAVQIFDAVLPDLPTRLTNFIASRPIHRSDDEVLPLQAAHTIAWLHRRHAQQRGLANDLGKWTPPLRILKKLGEIPTLYNWYPYERLAFNFSKARAELAEEGS